jgi:hypothetical protein
VLNKVLRRSYDYLTITYDHVGESRESNYVTAGSTWGGGWGPPRDRTRGAPTRIVGLGVGLCARVGLCGLGVSVYLRGARTSFGRRV